MLFKRLRKKKIPKIVVPKIHDYLIYYKYVNGSSVIEYGNTQAGFLDRNICRNDIDDLCNYLNKHAKESNNIGLNNAKAIIVNVIPLG
ncbi:hypothetical protein BJV85_002099 [Clostridium acetobutylicum]|uniref:Uncharacterized protein n=1 Tax=Clostridium acetobutylicum (strain ATCC 824 / DSM 792 / JCM 1419 / IAM 19013 / LMG 5710 / NBRC 13948 / NRRL B-527 / VKM B-1787 / 2291 / W) TaxID=272562 RepID=Q97HV9_CLOAB|nr:MULTISPECIES: hypothetical protein [Clostridium]AAK79861.1 Hypothetical protein CA_C1898 [Clostridium acetobutylicum ATCC 824]ADZ20947.1 Conserved hypothetical protein [Clostridium acetobutylicum EA 2018]AEI32036.1 hypothetical protein SMB_G1923 [Clostridium acetobutylicum DSM 1731]AWV79710.1 hypothetical protein DK921_06270 [Clostridium acetobutylicum]MBC2394313.1 hypothetical protein [Clostridium acetobutylicum]